MRAYSRDLRSFNYPTNFKPQAIDKYDGKTNPEEWMRLYSTAIRAAGEDSFVMANYLPFYLEAAGRYWLNSLPEGSVTSWSDLVYKFISNFCATCEKPGSHFDLA